jgi:hypothetical protein
VTVTVKHRDVPCPKCKVSPRSACRFPSGHILLHGKNAPLCKERGALARRVQSILRAHFHIVEKPCNGEAHRNPFIDHCMVCAPRWGVVEVLVPNDLPPAGTWYDEAASLTKDPIIVRMASEVPSHVDLRSWNFISAANDEYHRRGGKSAGYIGGPAEAIRQLKKGR